MTSRGAALAVSAVLIGAVLLPLARDPLDDDFPLSTYPMFATKRDTRISIDFAFGETAGGARRTLSPRVVGSVEVLQAATTIARAIGRGKAATDTLCRTIAKAVADDSRFDDVAVIAIASGREDAIAYLVDGTQGPEREHARCRVQR